MALCWPIIAVICIVFSLFSFLLNKGSLGCLHRLILNVAGFLCAVVLSDQGSCANSYIADAGLTAAITVAVTSCKQLHQHTSKLNLTVQEDILVGNKDMVKNGQGFNAAIGGIAQVNVGTFLHLIRPEKIDTFPLVSSRFLLQILALALSNISCDTNGS